MTDPIRSGGDSTTGLDPQLASVLCYLLGFVSGIVFLIVEKENRDVRFHAYQSVGTFLPLFVVSIAAGAIPLLGHLLAILVGPLSLILWLVLMVKAFQGGRFELPWVGEWAQRQAEAS